MAKVRQIATNWSKGELSPLLEGHSDLSAYFEGAATLENFMLLRQGGIRRAYGSRFVAEVKDSSSDVILLPFEFSVDEVYVLEVGSLYIRIYKGRDRLEGDSGPFELATPFTAADIRTIQYTQSASILFLFHGSHQQQRLNRVSDTEWTIGSFKGNPPPSFEKDSQIDAAIALSANTGNAVTFRVRPGNLLAGDSGRQIIIGSGRAVITGITDAFSGTCDIIDDFNQTFTPSVNTLTSVSAAVASVNHQLAINDAVVLTSGPQSGQIRIVANLVDVDNFILDAAFSANQTAQTWTAINGTASTAWALRLSPQTTLDPNAIKPVGRQVTLVAGVNAFRATDVGRYITIYAGLVKITARDSATQVRGTLLVEMSDAVSADPGAAPAGAWTIEDASWNDANGWPATGEFFQGRLYQAGTKKEPTAFWGSASDAFDVYAKGVKADDAVSYTVASRKVNRILWVTELDSKLVIGTTGAELTAEGSGSEKSLISPSAVPFIDKVAQNGVCQIQPIQANKRKILYVDRSRKKVFSMGVDENTLLQADTELTVGAEHITGSGIKLGPLAFQRRQDPRLYAVRDDGQLVTLTFSPDQKIMGFTRRTTDGTYQSVCVVPIDGGPDRVWCVVSRTIDGVEKKYIEFFEDNHEALQGRLWSSLQLDCAIVFTGLTGMTFPVPHLRGKTVGIVKNGVYIGEHEVLGDSITVSDELLPEDVLEVGLLYESRCVSMRPAKQGAVIDGVPRTWDSLFVRVHESLGGTVNGEVLEYPIQSAIGTSLYSGDLKVNGTDWDLEGRIDIVHREPYPLTILSAFGTLDLGDHD